MKRRDDDRLREYEYQASNVLHLVLDYLYNTCSVSNRSGPYDDRRRGIAVNWTEVGV